MNVKALTRGHAIPNANFEGAIHSSFPSALNVQLHHGPLISVLSKSQANQPRAIRVDVPQEFRFDDGTIHIGDPALSRAGIIRILHSTLTIDFRAVVVWHSHLDTVCVDFNSDSSRAAWHSIVALVSDHPASSGGIANTALAVLTTTELISSSPLNTQAFRAIRELTAATQNGDVRGALDASLKLIGLGPGLTPSGDDFLAGYITGLWATASTNDAPACFTQKLGERLAPHLNRTTSISAGFLRDAINRTASETTVEMLRSIAEGRPVALVERAARAALNVGSTSGADSVAGVLVGLAARSGQFA